MAERRNRRPPAAALALLAAAGSLPVGVGLPPTAAEARAARGQEQIGGTWDATWRNSSGETRKGLIVVEQRGSRISARIQSHGNVVATGAIAGSSFTLHGTRLGVPFTVTGRVQGRRMAGMLTAILVERRFTATRRRGR